MSQIQVAKEIIWLSELLNELQFSNVINEFFVVEISVYCLTVTIYCDNQNVQTLIKNFISHARSKHIDIQQHFVKNKIQNDTLDLQHVFSNDQIADDLIKSLFKNKFIKFRRDIDLYWSNVSVSVSALALYLTDMTFNIIWNIYSKHCDRWNSI